VFGQTNVVLALTSEADPAAKEVAKPRQWNAPAMRPIAPSWMVDRRSFCVQSFSAQELAKRIFFVNLKKYAPFVGGLIAGIQLVLALILVP
jgi:hypothetical protein